MVWQISSCLSFPMLLKQKQWYATMLWMNLYWIILLKNQNITKLSLRCFRFCKSPATPNKTPSTLHREWTITFTWCWFTSTSMKWRIFHLLMTIHLRLFNLSCLVFLRTLNWCNQEIKNRKIKKSDASKQNTKRGTKHFSRSESY